MLKRKIYDWLIDWKNRDHKCLIVKGQCQTGKTYIIERFGLENCEHMISFDLSETVPYTVHSTGTLMSILSSAI